MPDATLLEGGRALIDYGPLGIFVILLIAALVFTTKQWINKTQAVEAEKDKHIETVKAYAGESAANRQAMESNTTAIRTMLEFVKREA